MGKCPGVTASRNWYPYFIMQITIILAFFLFFFFQGYHGWLSLPPSRCAFRLSVPSGICCLCSRSFARSLHCALPWYCPIVDHPIHLFSVFAFCAMLMQSWSFVIMVIDEIGICTCATSDMVTERLSPFIAPPLPPPPLSFSFAPNYLLMFLSEHIKFGKLANLLFPSH